MQQTIVQKGCLLAGLTNLSVLVFSRGFTNAAISQGDPTVMSNFGLLMIILWGFAYIAVSKSLLELKWLAGVFALEKLVYVLAWVFWHKNNSLSAVFSEDFMAGIFFGAYGLLDFGFLLFFSLVFLRASSSLAVPAK